MKTHYLTTWAWGFAAGTSGIGEAGTTAVEQRTQSFPIMLNGSVSDVTPLFGPVHEAEWVGEHWAEQQRIHWETAINEALTNGGIHD